MCWISAFNFSFSWHRLIFWEVGQNIWLGWWADTAKINSNYSFTKSGKFKLDNYVLVWYVTFLGVLEFSQKLRRTRNNNNESRKYLFLNSPPPCFWPVWFSVFAEANSSDTTDTKWGLFSDMFKYYRIGLRGKFRINSSKDVKCKTN